MMVGKTGYGPSVKQSDINALIVSLAGQGKHVVRLKGGDPGIFGAPARKSKPAAPPGCSNHRCLAFRPRRARRRRSASR